MSNKKESDTVYITSMFSLPNISSPHSKHSKKSLNSLHKHKISLNNKSRNKQIIMKTECNTITPNKIDNTEESDSYETNNGILEKCM